MSYDELTTAFGHLSKPIGTLGHLYQQANDKISAAATVDDKGTVTIDEAALRAAIKEIVPPGTDGQYELMTEGLDLGFAVDANARPLLPWSMLTRPDLVHHLDSNAFQELGFLPRADVGAVGVVPGPGVRLGRAPAMIRVLPHPLVAPFAGLNPPAEVNTPENLTMLAKAAGSVAALEALGMPALYADHISASIWTLNPANMAKLVVREPKQPAGGAAPPAGDLGTTSTGQALSIDDFKDIPNCLKNAQVGWDNPFVLRLCFDKTCAAALSGLLALGLPALLKGAVALVTTGLTAAVGAVGGWVALAIILSCAYWALWITLAGNANGVCLHIPMPWTFGVVGPGWATGR